MVDSFYQRDYIVELLRRAKRSGNGRFGRFLFGSYKTGKSSLTS